MARSADAMYNDNFDDDFSDGGRERGSLADQIDIQHYLRILRKHKWPITLFTAAVTLLAAYYAYTATPIYSATSTLLIEEQNTSGMPQFEELYGLDTSNADYYQTQFELLKSRTLALRVINELDLWNNPELSHTAREAEAREMAAQRAALGEDPAGFKGTVDGLLTKIGLGNGGAIGESGVGESGIVEPISEDISVDQSSSMAVNVVTPANEDGLSPEQKQVVGSFMGRLSVSPVRKTKLVKIAFQSADPNLAATVANTVGEQYIESYLDSKMEMTTKASSWLGERLATLKVKLDESKGRLIAFKESNGLVDLDGGIGALDQQELLLATAELAQAESELSDRADVYREIQSLGANSLALQSLPAIQADALVQGTKIEQGRAQRELDELLNRYGERHPRVVDAKSALETLNRTLQGHVSRVAGSIEKDYRFSRQRVAGIRAKIDAGKQKFQVLGSKKFDLDALEREVSTNQEIYDTFFNRISEANSADGLVTANAIISDYAVASGGPIKPKKQMIIALAGLASLVLSMLMAFLYEQMDDTIKSTNDVEGKLGINLLGILPLVKSGIFKGKQDLPLNPAEIKDAKGRFGESVNTMRTAICMDDGDTARKVIMVTSSVPGEGKSTASMNLAYSLAQLERVLLIDCDMRRPTVAKAAGLDKNTPGLSSLITGSAKAHECIHHGVFDGSVDVIPSGPIPEQPLELISSKRFQKIIAQLSEHYDRIVIDSAPTQAVSDALVLSKLCDGVVYAVKSHDTSIELVKRGLQRLKQVHAPIAGVVITQVDIDKITAYGGDYYYQGYYDYYGYSEKGDKKQKKGGGKLRLTQEELMVIKNDDSDFNLDLDYGRDGNAPAGMARRTQSKVATGVAADNTGLFDDSNEFDLTTQVDVSDHANGRSKPAARMPDQKPNRKRFRDDLDII